MSRKIDLDFDLDHFLEILIFVLGANIPDRWHNSNMKIFEATAVDFVALFDNGELLMQSEGTSVFTDVDQARTFNGIAQKLMGLSASALVAMDIVQFGRMGIHLPMSQFLISAIASAEARGCLSARTVLNHHSLLHRAVVNRDTLPDSGLPMLLSASSKHWINYYARAPIVCTVAKSIRSLQKLELLTTRSLLPMPTDLLEIICDYCEESEQMQVSTYVDDKALTTALQGDPSMAQELYKLFQENRGDRKDVRCQQWLTQLELSPKPSPPSLTSPALPSSAFRRVLAKLQVVSVFARMLSTIRFRQTIAARPTTIDSMDNIQGSMTWSAPLPPRPACLLRAQLSTKLFPPQHQLVLCMDRAERHLLEHHHLEVQTSGDMAPMYSGDPRSSTPMVTGTSLYLDHIQQKVLVQAPDRRITAKGLVLASNIGLGKTLTFLSLVNLSALEARNIGPDRAVDTGRLVSPATLVVCPSHLVKQWAKEAKDFYPHLKVCRIHSKREHEALRLEQLRQVDLIIVSRSFLTGTYYRRYLKNVGGGNPVRASLPKDVSTLQQMATPFSWWQFRRLGIDEAHEINVGQYVALHGLSAEVHWVISGTPFSAPPRTPQCNQTGLANICTATELVLHSGQHNRSRGIGHESPLGVLIRDALHHHLLFRITPAMVAPYVPIYVTPVEDRLLVGLGKEQQLYHDLLPDKNRLTAVNTRPISNAVDSSKLLARVADTAKHRTRVMLRSIENFMLIAHTVSTMTTTPFQFDTRALQVACKPSFWDKVEAEPPKLCPCVAAMGYENFHQHPHNYRKHIVKICSTAIVEQVVHDAIVAIADNVLKHNAQAAVRHRKYLATSPDLNSLAIAEARAEINKVLASRICTASTELLDFVANVFVSPGRLWTPLSYAITRPKELLSVAQAQIQAYQQRPTTTNPSSNILYHTRDGTQEEIVRVYKGQDMSIKVSAVLNYLIAIGAHDDSPEPVSVLIFINDLHTAAQLKAEGGADGKHKISFLACTGNYLCRNKAIATFTTNKKRSLGQKSGKVMILSLEEAASGTNLQGATHLIFAESATGSHVNAIVAEKQAIGRVLRVGLTKPPTVMRVVVVGSADQQNALRMISK